MASCDLWEKNECNVVEDWPGEEAKVVYENNITLQEIGQVVTPTQVQNQPKVAWTASADKLYTVMMMDPDAPSRENPSFAQWYHWGVINVPGNDIDKGEVIAAYVGAGPPANTGLHRYIIVVYEQNGEIKFKGNKLELKLDGRGKQNLKEMNAKHGFGKLIAGACFQAEHDDYVPQLMKKLGV